MMTKTRDYYDESRTDKARFFRLGEEQDQFCGVCVRQWEHKRIWQAWIHGEGVHDGFSNPDTCHVCSKPYTADSVIFAMPITSKMSGEASICCRECYDLIKEIQLRGG